MNVPPRHWNAEIAKSGPKLDTKITCVACHTQMFGQGSGQRWRARIRAHELFPPLSFTAVGGRGRECDLRDSVFHGGWWSGRECDLRDSALALGNPSPKTQRWRSAIRAQRLSAGARESEPKDSALAMKYFLGQSEPKDFSLALSESELKDFSPALAIRVSALFWGHVWIIIIKPNGWPNTQLAQHPS